MKKFDLVKLINEKPYLHSNLEKDMHGVVVGVFVDYLKVMFFHPHNLGEYVVVNVKPQDLVLEKEELPESVRKELSDNLEKYLLKSKDVLQPLKIKAYDRVELLVENEKYAKFGVHKGDTGCVMDDNAVDNCVDVDFSGIDENGNYYGDCILVKIEDIKVL